MSASYTITRLNQGLPFFQTHLNLDKGQHLSKRDASIKSLLQAFLKEQNFIFDPSKPSFIRKEVFKLCSDELDVVLAASNKLRKSKKIERNIPQRFDIQGICSFTLLKARKTMLCIHQKDANSSGCEKRGLSHGVAIGISGKKISLYREIHALKPLKAQEKATSTALKVNYLYRSSLSKVHYSVKCTLERQWHPISLQDFLQWRSKYGFTSEGMSLSAELYIVASTVNYVRFLAFFNRSCNGYKPKDLKLSFSPEVLKEQGQAVLERNVNSAQFLNTLELIHLDLEHVSTNPHTIANDLDALLSLMHTLILHSPKFAELEPSAHEDFSEFMRWVSDLKESIPTDQDASVDSMMQNRISLLYQCLADIDVWNGDVEGFCFDFFEKADRLEQTHMLMNRLNQLSI